MKIGVFGLGIIGSIWAENLRQDGHDVLGWNRTPKPLSWYRSSAREVARDAEVIFIVVADPPAVQNVLDQILPVLHAGQLVIQSSTISPKATREFATQVQKTGAGFLEAPFTGSKPAAEKRQTVFYLGGDAAVVEQARPVLERLSSTRVHIGPLGTASTLKLAMNLNLANMAQALCESLALARAAGISDDTYFKALANNVGRSGLSDFKEPKLRQADYSPQFSLKHMGKDLRLAVETAAEYSLTLGQTEHLKTEYEDGIAAGWQDDDFIGLMRLLEKRKGRS